MIGLIFVLLVFLLIYLIFTESVTVRFTILDKPRFKISFTFFSFTFEIPRKSNRKNTLKRKFDSSLFAVRLFNIALASSILTITSYQYDQLVLGKSGIPKIHIAILAPVFLSYVKSQSAITIFESDDYASGIDLRFEIILYSLFISFLKASYYTLKRNIGRN